MAIPKSEQGLDPAALDKFKRGTRDDPIAVSRPVSVQAVRASDRLEAATKLGDIFLQVRAEDRRLDDWALPGARTAMDERVLPYQLDAPTAIVLGADLNLKARIRLYDRYFEAVMPDVGKKGLEWGLRTLTQQSQNLRLLLLEISENNFAEWMRQAANEITRRATDCLDKARAADLQAKSRSGVVVDPRYASPADQFKRVRELLRMFNSCLVSAAKSFVASPTIKASTASYLQPQIPLAIQIRYLQVLQVLLAHSKMTEILQAYRDSAAAGTVKASGLVQESYRAIDDFKASLAGSPRSVWRYPVLIVGGLRELGLENLASFKEYAITIGAVEARKSPETLLNYIGLGLFAVALLSGVGVGLAFLDVAVSGAGTAFSFVRERQQDNAVKASMFLPDNSKYATEGGYGDTALGLAFTFVAALSFFSVARAARATKASAAKEAALTGAAPIQEPKGNVITDAARGKENAASVRPESGKPPEASSSVQPKDAAAGNTSVNPAAGVEAPAGPKTQNAPQSSPAKAYPVDEFADLKLAANEAPTVANPTPDQVADHIKAFRKQMRRLEASGLKVANFKDFYLTPRQAQTFSRLSDAVLNSGARAIPEVLTAGRAALLSESEVAAESLRLRLKAHWDAALPRRGKQTAEEAALELLIKLTKEPPKKGTLNSNIRDKFFNNWRERFLKRVARDETLIRDLEVQAGIVFGSEEAPSAFSVLVRDDAGRFSFVGLDLDHAVIRHEDAVTRALRTGDATLLTSTVDSANLQLMTARENRFVIERLRELDELYWSVQAGPVPRSIQPFR